MSMVMSGRLYGKLMNDLLWNGDQRQAHIVGQWISGNGHPQTNALGLHSRIDMHCGRWLGSGPFSRTVLAPLRGDRWSLSLGGGLDGGGRQ